MPSRCRRRGNSGSGGAERPASLLSEGRNETEIVLFKQLAGSTRYGSPASGADVLYTGTRGEWLFELPPFLLFSRGFEAKLIIRAALDDHMRVPLERYRARISVNGTPVHDGRLFLEHGAPCGGPFLNWRDMTFSFPLRARVRVAVENTSEASERDWLAINSMELRLRPC